MKGYKGFEKGLICRDKQYKENTVFEESRPPVACESGMHFCTNPFSVLYFYPLVDDCGELNEFAEVEALGEIDTDDNTKFCTDKLKICTKLKLDDFISSCIEFIKKETKISNSKTGITSNCSGVSTQIASSGDSTQIASSGVSTQIASSGDSTQIASSGVFTKIASSGVFTKIASSGVFTKIASSGDSTQIASSGVSTQIASSGDSTKIGSSGDSTKIASSGDSTKIVSLGANSVVMCAGQNSVVSAKKGSWITLVEWKDNVPILVKTEYVDGERIKEDTAYTLVNGNFCEVIK